MNQATNQVQIHPWARLGKYIIQGPKAKERDLEIIQGPDAVKAQAPKSPKHLEEFRKFSMFFTKPWKNHQAL